MTNPETDPDPWGEGTPDETVIEHAETVEYAETVAHAGYGSAPVPKVTAATAAASLATVVVILIQAFTGANAPVGLEGAIATLFAFAAGYMAPPP
jgi:hypothetical protein